MVIWKFLRPRARNDLTNTVIEIVVGRDTIKRVAERKRERDTKRQKEGERMRVRGELDVSFYWESECVLVCVRREER